MKELFQFSQADIARILYEELIRTGKVERKSCSIHTTFAVQFGIFQHIDVRIDNPVPGLKEIY